MNILSIDQLRNRKYPASELKIEEKIKNESDFTGYIASYYSDDLKIYGYLVVPQEGSRPEALGNSTESFELAGPIASSLSPKASLVVFCHGYVDPKDYLPGRQYAGYVESLAKAGFVVFQPDYRGHGNSEGDPESIFEAGYTVDVLNAISAFQSGRLPQPLCGFAMTDCVGIFGHSLGGNIALRVMEVSTDIKAGVIWAGAVVSFEDNLKRWGKNNRIRPQAQAIIDKYGEPKINPQFWRSISPINFVEYITAPVQMHHGNNDDKLPPSQSETLEQVLQKAGKPVKLYLYEKGDHNFTGAEFVQALQKSTEFFEKYLK